MYYHAIENMFDDSEDYYPVNPEVERMLEESLDVEGKFQNEINHMRHLKDWYSNPTIHLLDCRLDSNSSLYLMVDRTLNIMSYSFNGNLEMFLRSINWTRKMWGDWYSAIQMRDCSEIIKQFANRYTKYMRTSLTFWDSRGNTSRNIRPPKIRDLFP